MKTPLFLLILLAMLLPVGFGCGSSQPSYKDRIGDVDTSAPEVEIPPPGKEKGAKQR